MRRGFKSEANAIAREIRSELRLSAAAPLDPFLLSAWLEVPLIKLSDLSPAAPHAVTLLMGTERGVLSAVTVFCGCKRAIVYNDANTQGRQRSDIAHELAHALLHHPARPAFDAAGRRIWDRELESEADWLGGALLVSDEAALSIVRRGLSIEEAAIEFGVSDDMMRFRVNVTGARIRVARADGVRPPRKSDRLSRRSAPPQ